MTCTSSDVLSTPADLKHSEAGPHTTITANTILPHYKSGPKANQGAINAGLRALDRTGKPTRKWAKKGFQVKSFTGVTWQTPFWGARGNRTFAEDVKSDTTGSSEDPKPGNASGMPSDRSNSGAEAVGSAAAAMDVASSPAPVAAVDEVQAI